MTAAKHPGSKSGPLVRMVQTIQDGRFLRVLFLAMLGLSLGTVGYDFQQLVANAPGTLPGSQRREPAPFDLPTPGDQTRPYLPRTIPLSPDRGKPNLPGYFGPVDGSEIAQEMTFHKGPNGEVSAVGTITPGTSKRLRSFLTDNKKKSESCSCTHRVVLFRTLSKWRVWCVVREYRHVFQRTGTAHLPVH